VLGDRHVICTFGYVRVKYNERFNMDIIYVSISKLNIKIRRKIFWKRIGSLPPLSGNDRWERKRGEKRTNHSAKPSATRVIGGSGETYVSGWNIALTIRENRWQRKPARNSGGENTEVLASVDRVGVYRGWEISMCERYLDTVKLLRLF